MLRRTLLLAAGLVGCGTPPPKPPPSPGPSLHLEPLADLAAAGGLDALVQVRLSEALRGLAGPVAALLPENGLRDLGDYLGLDLALVQELLVASYGPTTLYLLRGPHDPRKVERLFQERLTDDVVRSNDGPGVARLSGRIGQTPRAIATFLPDVTAYEVGPSGPLKASVAFAQGRLKKAKPALRVEPLLSLAARLEDAPIRAFFPSPAASWRGAHGLLERASAAAVSFAIREGNLALRVTLMGAWDDPPTEALRRLELTLADVATAPLGRLTGLDTPIAPFRYSGEGEFIQAEATLDAMRLARGLRDITRSSMTELFPGLLKK